MNWTDLTLFLYIGARMSGFVLFNPILGRRNLPGVFRSGLILILSVFVYSSVAQQSVAVPTKIPVFAMRILMELLIGFFLGMVLHFFLQIPHLAGLIVDTQMGMTMNQIYDSGSQGNMSVTGELLNVLLLLLFFAGNGHHTLLRIMLSSGQIVPYGAAGLGDTAIQAMLSLFVETILLGIKLAMPILAAELIGQLGMGILMKVIPQINVFSINIELKVLIGLVILFVMIAPFSEFLLSMEVRMLNSLEQVLALLGT